MFTRTHRTRMLAAAALAAATLTLTACNNGEGVDDEGASAGSSATGTAATPSASSPEAGGASKGSTGGAAGSGDGATPSASKGSSGTSGSSGSSGGSADSASDSSATTVACAKTSTRTTAKEVSRPLNHLLLTVTNTGSKNCTLIDYPAVRFGEAQSVPPVFEDSKPQAVVTLAPGESGYASVLLSAADGSGSNGYTAKSLEVYFNSAAKTAARPSLPAKGVYIDSSIQVSYWQSTMADALAW
ncbi:MULTISPECIES: DUF4232 domain-containing protein [unclassified Streptomyces]|uniref:DUF4232 domain-containing protein n=1 Tax=unclassified Streptomyces TaxID=2593676 RepID=UPI0036E1E43D